MPAKILTVDDSKTIRLIVARAFKSFDCEIIEAANGVEGLAVASREKPDVIILDVTMPVMDGTEMLGRLKSNSDLKSIPVIMLTAEAGRENVLRIAKMGVRDYLVKPFKEDQIVERVGRIVELKQRGGTVKTRKRFDDALNLLFIDDKTAIHDQIKAGLADTNWKIEGQCDAHIALELIGEKLPDLAFISTSLPDGAGFWLFQKLRGSMKTERLPLFAMSVKTAMEDQARAQQLGFTGVITKPIDFSDLKAKITRTLNLDASYKYFEQKSGVLVLNFPSNFGPNVANDITTHLGEKVTEAVDSGLDKIALDFSQIKTVDTALIELGINVIKYAQNLSMKTGAICPDTVSQACKNYEETNSWIFAGTLDDLLAAINKSQQGAG
jgi:two-component system cell cycle response regulator